VRPAARCSQLRPGDPISEVYFQLGDPSHVAGDRYEWFGKGNFGAVPDAGATISGGRLISLYCR
jgi:hypothetical protein